MADTIPLHGEDNAPTRTLTCLACDAEIDTGNVCEPCRRAWPTGVEIGLLYRALDEVAHDDGVVSKCEALAEMVRLGIPNEGRADFVMRAADGLCPLDAGYEHGGGWSITEDTPGSEVCRQTGEILRQRSFNALRGGYAEPDPPAAA